MDCAPRQSTTRRHPYHAEEAVTPTGTARHLRAAIAGAAPSRLPRRIGGGVNDLDHFAHHRDLVRQILIRPPLPPLPRLFWRGSRWGAMIAMATSKHRDAPEGVQE